MSVHVTRDLCRLWGNNVSADVQEDIRSAVSRNEQTEREEGYDGDGVINTRVALTGATDEPTHAAKRSRKQ